MSLCPSSRLSGWLHCAEVMMISRRPKRVMLLAGVLCRKRRGDWTNHGVGVAVVPLVDVQCRAVTVVKPQTGNKVVALRPSPAPCMTSGEAAVVVRVQQVLLFHAGVCTKVGSGSGVPTRRIAARVG